MPSLTSAWHCTITLVVVAPRRMQSFLPLTPLTPSRTLRARYSRSQTPETDQLDAARNAIMDATARLSPKCSRKFHLTQSTLRHRPPPSYLPDVGTSFRTLTSLPPVRPLKARQSSGQTPHAPRNTMKYDPAGFTPQCIA